MGWKLGLFMFTRLVARKAKGELSWAELEPKKVAPRCLSVSPVKNIIKRIQSHCDYSDNRRSCKKYALCIKECGYVLYVIFFCQIYVLAIAYCYHSSHCQPLPTFALCKSCTSGASPGRGARTALLHLSATAKPYPSHITIHRKIPLNHSFL